MSLTTDPKDPKLKEGQQNKTGQHEIYLVLSEEERAKGFVRPYRDKYVHVGIGGHEIDPNDRSKHGRTGNACGALTSMGRALSETYARDPKFYGATIEIPTLDGKAKMKIDAGTQSGRVLRLKGKGIPDVNGYGKGDLLISVNVWTPQNLSSDEKSTMEDLGESEKLTRCS